MTLPVFKRNPTCPKCGHDGIVFEYKAETIHREDERQVAWCGLTAEEHFSEHFHLQCNRCDYGKGNKWSMSVAESPERIVGFRQRAVA